MSSSNKSIIRGRFVKQVDKKAQKFSASHIIDRVLYPFDIEGSIAHAKMLCSINLLTRKEKSLIINGLKKINQELEDDKFEFNDTLE
ncbi:hypothetical protein BVX93_00755, partial [bacterium B13(2017)]